MSDPRYRYVDGEGERIALAMMNSNMRSDLLVLNRRIADLEGELESHRNWSGLLAGNNCYCTQSGIVPDVCAPCAYRQTMRQNEEAHREQ